MTPKDVSPRRGDLDVRAARAEFGSIIASVGESIVDEDHLLEVLDWIIAVACTVVDGADHCALTVDINGRTFTACTTDIGTLDIDAEQYRADSGPCLSALRTSEVIVADCDTLDERWPDFGAAAREHGVHSLLAAPIPCADNPFGALSLYGTAPKAFDTVDQTAVTVITSVAGRAIADYARLCSAQDTAAGLQDALKHRAPIEQAKGILMALHRIDGEQAFALLVTESQNTNRRIREIAMDFVADVSAAAPTPSLTDRS